MASTVLNGVIIYKTEDIFEEQKKEKENQQISPFKSWTHAGNPFEINYLHIMRPPRPPEKIVANLTNCLKFLKQSPMIDLISYPTWNRCNVTLRFIPH